MIRGENVLAPLRLGLTGQGRLPALPLRAQQVVPGVGMEHGRLLPDQSEEADSREKRAQSSVAGTMAGLAPGATYAPGNPNATAFPARTRVRDLSGSAAEGDPR